jgi:hypothetical protein
MKKVQLDFVKDSGFLKYYHLTEKGLAFAFDNGDRYEISRIDRFIEDEALKNKLQTQEKENDCHRGSWNLMNHLECFGGKNIVTSYITGACKEAQYLHTWVEFESEGKKFLSSNVASPLKRTSLFAGKNLLDIVEI